MFLSSSRRRRAGAAAVAASAWLALAGCSSTSQLVPSVSSLGSALSPYKAPILQGNVVTREQAQAVQPGMQREQVRNILGTPLLASVFHAERWDYVFTLRRQGQEPQQRKVTVFFKGDAVERIEADELPTEAEFVASLDVRRRGAKIPPLEASEADLRAFQVRNNTAVEPEKTPLAAPAASYPPLESR